MDLGSFDSENWGDDDLEEESALDKRLRLKAEKDNAAKLEAQAKKEKEEEEKRARDEEMEKREETMRKKAADDAAKKIQDEKKRDEELADREAKAKVTRSTVATTDDTT